MFNKYGRIADYVYTCRNKNDMNNITDKIRAYKRDDYKTEFKSSSRKDKKSTNHKSKMKLGGAGIDCLTK